MEYERLTKQNKEPKTIFCFSGSMQDFKIYKRLQELEDKIENGTLVELPCPIRTMVYYIASLEKKIWFREKRKYCYTIMEIPFELEMLDSYGNNWFLTREEAEKRLEELKKWIRK